MTDHDRALAWRQDAEHPVTGNSSQERAIAWLDAHPEVVGRAGVEGFVAKLVLSVEDNPEARWGRLSLSQQVIELRIARAVLVAFLTSPRPCATCKGRGMQKSVPGTSGIFPVETNTVEGCDDCNGSGTAGILLDQLEARYEQVGWRTTAANRFFLTDKSVEGDEPVFRKLPSPEEG